MTLLETYCEEYLGKVFYFALKKTGNADDADDLASDVSLAVVSALRGGFEPGNFDAWVWAVARNRWKRFARRRYYGPEAEAESFEDAAETIPDGENIDESLVLSEDLGLLRRELAFIRSDYRQILVAHYFENKSVSAIAREFSIPLGTVKTKLQSSRKKLKEGMEMARTFGKRSYAPEQVTFWNTGSFGDKGQPWTILSHLMYKNVFLEAHENPSTAEELSLELGIALPYMEDELEFLVREEFLKKTGNKYETAFPIRSREEQRAWHELKKKVSKEAAPLIERYLDAARAAFEKNGVDWFGPWVSYEDAKWTLLMEEVDRIEHAALGDWLVEEPIPERPDNGRWKIIGMETVDFEEPLPVGRHGYLDAENKLVGRDPEFGQFKFVYRELENRTPLFLSRQEVLTIWRVAVGRMEECDPELLGRVAGYGFLRRTESGYEPAIVVYPVGEPLDLLPEADRAKLRAMCDKAVAVMRELREIVVDGFGTLMRGYILEEALASGWLTYEEGKTPGTVGAYLHL
ncbi:MAG: sigma-70 family RNA polymerase sigma factor [Clostridia bacterium]|nr:sigma-70 family RNA polymerase sigma factor [Clostridia bacterium]